MLITLIILAGLGSGTGIGGSLLRRSVRKKRQVEALDSGLTTSAHSYAETPFERRLEACGLTLARIRETTRFGADYRTFRQEVWIGDEQVGIQSLVQRDHPELVGRLYATRALRDGSDSTCSYCGETFYIVEIVDRIPAPSDAVDLRRLKLTKLFHGCPKCGQMMFSSVQGGFFDWLDARSREGDAERLARLREELEHREELAARVRGEVASLESRQLEGTAYRGRLLDPPDNRAKQLPALTGAEPG